MGVSQVDICNSACTLLGVALITSISDQSNQARTLAALWDSQRQAELRAHRWKFAIARAALPALASVPVSGPYNQQFQLPADWLRTLEVGDSYPGSDLSDYRSGPTTDDYSQEGNLILSNLSAPLSLRYIRDVADPTQFDATFCDAFSCILAYQSCFRLTQSTSQQAACKDAYKEAIKDAIRANALETTPTVQADDTWVTTRAIGAGGAPNLRYG